VVSQKLVDIVAKERIVIKPLNNKNNASVVSQKLVDIVAKERIVIKPLNNKNNETKQRRPQRRNGCYWHNDTGNSNRNYFSNQFNF
jgi:hypothetical protein